MNKFQFIGATVCFASAITGLLFNFRIEYIMLLDGLGWGICFSSLLEKSKLEMLEELLNKLNDDGYLNTEKLKQDGLIE
jgi:hypothetical protein